jgi:hypothetical protein
MTATGRPVPAIPPPAITGRRSQHEYGHGVHTVRQLPPLIAARARAAYRDQVPSLRHAQRHRQGLEPIPRTPGASLEGRFPWPRFGRFPETESSISTARSSGSSSCAMTSATNAAATTGCADRASRSGWSPYEDLGAPSLPRGDVVQGSAGSSRCSTSTVEPPSTSRPSCRSRRWIGRSAW